MAVPRRLDNNSELNRGLSGLFIGYRPLALVGVAVMVLALCIGIAVSRHRPVPAPSAAGWQRPVLSDEQVSRPQPVPAPPAGLTVADETYCLRVAASKPYLASLNQIPATVIDKGVLRNVPYKSYRSGDYELNVYGDPDQPAGVEIGVYHDLLTDKQAKQHCVDFVTAVLPNAEDQNFLASLNLTKDMVVHGDITIEVTPPTDDDAYGGWWVSAYRLGALDHARASEADLARISVPRKEVEANPTNAGEWSTADLKFARPPASLAPAQPPGQNGPVPQPPVQYQPMPTGPIYTPPQPSGGSVYVRGYTRKNGTYVHSYTRRH
ncbi:MAG TPA: hypothetical protein DDY78_03590 [Planctomycetales bacterium]|nr:hypothetical protein [Planctomycetales bacterium]